MPLRGIIFQDRDYGDKILVEGEDIEMFKKHEQEKMAAMKEDELQIEDEMEAVRCSSVSTLSFSLLKYYSLDVLRLAVLDFVVKKNFFLTTKSSTASRVNTN